MLGLCRDTNQVDARDQNNLLASIAISLKRIADALANPANKYGETFFEAVATAMREEK